MPGKPAVPLALVRPWHRGSCETRLPNLPRCAGKTIMRAVRRWCSDGYTTSRRWRSPREPGVPGKRGAAPGAAAERVPADQHDGLAGAMVGVVDLDVGRVLLAYGNRGHGFPFRSWIWLGRR